MLAEDVYLLATARSSVAHVVCHGPLTFVCLGRSRPTLVLFLAKSFVSFTMRLPTGAVVAGVLQYAYHVNAQTIVVGGEIVGKIPDLTPQVTNVAKSLQLPQ
jgi:hypothetical protein